MGMGLFTVIRSSRNYLDLLVRGSSAGTGSTRCFHSSRNGNMTYNSRSFLRPFSQLVMTTTQTQRAVVTQETNSLVSGHRYHSALNSAFRHRQTPLREVNTTLTPFEFSRSLRPSKKNASCLQILRRFFENHHFLQRFDTTRKIPHDVLIYSHRNDNFYRMLSYFGIFQMCIWSYLALFSFQQLKTSPGALQDTSNLPWWKKFLYKEGQYKNALSALSLCVGSVVLFITVTYPRRAIKSLWLLKGGEKAKIITYSWMGRNQMLTTPVEHINCMESRTGRGSHVPLKIKDKTFFFLVDKQGDFHNAEIFDFVIGVQRKF